MSYAWFPKHVTYLSSRQKHFQNDVHQEAYFSV